jgi:hypothetical protein
LSHFTSSNWIFVTGSSRKEIKFQGFHVRSSHFPNMSDKEMSSGEEQRKEIYYKARTGCGKRQSKHFSLFLETDMSLKFKGRIGGWGW